MIEIIKNKIVISAVIVYVLLKFINIEIIPDYLKLSSIDPLNYFTLIIGSTTSIFGILIAVILLTFQFVKNSAFRRKDSNILTKPIVTNLVGIAVSIIILTLISYLTIHDFKQSNNLSIAYFHGFIFIGFIIAIYPAAAKILETANTLKGTIEEIKNLTIENFDEVSTLKNDKFISNKNNLSLIRERQELLSYVRECDYEAYTQMLVELNKKAIQLIGKGQDRKLTRIVFRGISIVWNAGNFEALRVGNYQFYETIWECIEELYEYGAKEKISLLHFEELEYFLRNYIKFLSRNKLGDSLSSGAKVLSIILKHHLKFNCPPQEEIMDLYLMFDDDKKMPHDVESSIKWKKINKFIDLLINILTTSIEIVDKELFETCFIELEYIVLEISWDKFPNLKVYQEACIVQRIIHYQTHNAFIANDENLYKESARAFFIDSFFISELIKEEKFYIGRILEYISDFIIKSQRKERLDDLFTLNFWGALGRHISKIYLENETAQIAMDYIIDTFEKLKEEIETNQLPNQVKNYNEIKKQCESIKKWLQKDNEGKEIPIIEKIEQIIDSFKEVNREADSRIVEWKNNKRIANVER